jgi:hypothetical protein
MGMNRYAYAQGNPILYIDPSGHWSWRQTGGVFQMVGGAVEMVVGGVLIASCETGIGCVAAGGMMVLGADTFAAGGRTVKNDEPSMTYLQQGATWAGVQGGMDPQDAAAFGFAVNMTTHVAVGGIAGAEAGVSAGLGGSGFTIAEGGAASAFLGVTATVSAATVASTVGASIGAFAAASGGGQSMSTGRAYAQSLKEQLAMEQVKSNPGAGKVLDNITMGDPRWPASDGWVKMSQRVNGVEVHYVYNTRTGAVADFKFK